MIEPTGLCPHDGAPATQNERYFDALCGGCRDRGTDGTGRPVALYNQSPFGGFQALHRDDDSLCESVTRTHTVYIDGRPYYADEARFGGIVVRPLERMPTVLRERNPGPGSS